MAVMMGFDESGRGDTLLVSAQIGVVQTARKMDTKWKAELRKQHIPFFHSVDYDNVTGGVFKGLTREERRKLLDYLTFHLRKRMFFGMTAKITISTYNAKTDNKFRSQWAAAYSFAVQLVMLQTSLVLEHFKLGDEVHILLEEGHANSAQAIQILLRMKKARETGSTKVPLRIMTAELGSKADYPILQGADMLAYSEWQNINQIRGDVYHALHLDPTESRYQVGYLDLDDEIVDIALGVAQRSDRAKALSKKIEWHNRTQSRNGWEELQEQIRQYQKERDEAESALELKAEEIKASRAART
jgi:hypothetical protein